MSKHTIPTELNIAPRGKSWLHGQLIDGEHGHPTRQSMENAESAQPNKTSATVAVPIGWAQLSEQDKADMLQKIRDWSPALHPEHGYMISPEGAVFAFEKFLADKAHAALAATPAAVQTHAEAAAALCINSALTRIRAGNHAEAIEPLEHALRALGTTTAAAAPVVLPEPAAWINQRCIVHDGECAGHEPQELNFKRHGDWTKSIALFSEPQLRALLAGLSAPLKLAPNLHTQILNIPAVCVELDRSEEARNECIAYRDGHKDALKAAAELVSAAQAAGATQVVMPKPDAAIREVLALVNQAVRIGQEAARHDFHIRPTDSVNSLKRLDSAMLTIETKLRALLAGVSVPMVPPEWEKVRRGLTMVMLGFAGRPDCSESAAEAALDAVTEPGMPLAGLRMLAGVSAPAAVAVEQAPVLYVSRGQLANHRDPDGPDSTAHGRYLPARITPAGKFTTPLFAVPHVLTPAARDVLAERQRQITQEGYDPQYDDDHVNDEIAAMAALFIMPEGARDWDATSTSYGDTLAEALLPSDWEIPNFGDDRRRQLVKGTAMGLAEIERIDRAAVEAAKGQQA